MKLELKLEKMIHGAKTLARLADGRIALVTGGLPGEVVEAELAEKKGVLQGLVTRVLEASPYRQEASKHPGLDYSFMPYSYQLELKRELIRDALERSLKREMPVPEVRASPNIWHYRSVVQPVVTRQGLGYRRPESHDLVVLEQDPVANAAIAKAWQELSTKAMPKGLRELVLRGNDKAEVVVSLIASASAKHYLDFAHKLLGETIKGVSYAAFDARGRFRQGSEKLTGQKTIEQVYGKFRIRVSSSSFAQPNPLAASALYERLTALADSGKHALDLYAGSGIIAMHLAEAYKEVTALEIDASSVSRGRQDAENLGIKNLNFVKADARALELSPFDLICVDPPRSGLNKELRNQISASAVKKLLYVSCDLPTWLRDTADFEAQGWSLAQLEAFDFYPHTHHIELLSVLLR